MSSSGLCFTDQPKESDVNLTIASIGINFNPYFHSNLIGIDEGIALHQRVHGLVGSFNDMPPLVPSSAPPSMREVAGPSAGANATGLGAARDVEMHPIAATESVVQDVKPIVKVEAASSIEEEGDFIIKIDASTERQLQ